MPKYEPTEAKLILRETGEEIAPGSKMANFRGEEVEFEYVSRLPEPGKEGKIIINSPTLHGNGSWSREVYPSVVEARIEIVKES